MTSGLAADLSVVAQDGGGAWWFRIAPPVKNQDGSAAVEFAACLELRHGDEEARGEWVVLVARAVVRKLAAANPASGCLHPRSGVSPRVQAERQFKSNQVHAGKFARTKSPMQTTPAPR